MKLLLCTIFSLLHVAYSAKILGAFLVSSYSHQIIYQPVWKELSLRGHQVTVITPNPLKDPTLVNLTEIDVHDVLYDIWRRSNISTYGVVEEADVLDWSLFMRVMLEQMDALLANEKVRKIFAEGKKGDFDLVIMEPISGIPVLKDVYDCPLVVMQSYPMMTLMHKAAGNPTHPVLYPEIFLPFGRNLNFFKRVQSTLFHVLAEYIFMADAWKFEERLRRLVPNMRDPNLALSEASMMFTNTNPVFEVRRPNVAGVVEFSGMHIKPPKPLPADLQAFMDNATEGVVYISFGSNIRSSDMPIHKLKFILGAISELPFKVLWKFEADNLPLQPPNLLVQKWLPQQDVLRHPNLKLFVTQGGLQSLEEAMYTATPVVAVPFFGDQQANALKVDDVGMGKYLRYATLTKDALKDSIMEVSTEKYAKRALELQKIVTDKPQQPLEMVTWWIEYVIRHKGAKHLRSPALDIPTYQFYLLDVIGFVLGVTFILLFVAVKSVKFLLRLCLGSDKKRKKE